jgi:uncharacterized protein YqgQ
MSSSTVKAIMEVLKPTEEDLLLAKFARDLKNLEYRMIMKDLEKLFIKGVLSEEDTFKFERLVARKHEAEKEMN